MKHPANVPAAADDPAHHEAQELLPWLANGTLAGAELERVQSHLQGCAACRADLALLHTLRAAGPGSEPAVDAESALARLLPQLDSQIDPQAAPALQATPRWRDRIAANDRSWLRAAIVAQCGVITVLGLLLAGRQGNVAQAPGSYHALGAGDAATAQLVVMFKPETPERELRRIVGAHGVRIVGGPTVTNAWLLNAADGGTAAALAGLRAEPAVTLAEPLAGQTSTEGQP